MYSYRWGRARYRVRQFFRGFRTRLATEEISAVRSLLSDRELSLFVEMDRRDQRHSVDLMFQLDRVEASAPPSSALRRAALLHDVGKGRLTVWTRVLFVLLNAVSVSLSRRIEVEGARGVRGALWRLRYHASLGANPARGPRCRRAGVGPRAVPHRGGAAQSTAANAPRCRAGAPDRSRRSKLNAERRARCGDTMAGRPIDRFSPPGGVAR